MKTFKISTFAFFTALLFITSAHAQQKSLNGSFNILINKYLLLKDALITNTCTVVAPKAKIFSAAVVDVPKTGLTVNDAALLTKLEADAKQISEVNNITVQREHFASLSNNLYTLVKNLKVNNTVLYRQYCTMTKRYFLSQSNKGADPYMGMDNCSKVIETLPAAKK